MYAQPWVLFAPRGDNRPTWAQVIAPSGPHLVSRIGLMVTRHAKPRPCLRRRAPIRSGRITAKTPKRQKREGIWFPALRRSTSQKNSRSELEHERRTAERLNVNDRTGSFQRRRARRNADPKNLCSPLLAFWRFGGSNSGAARVIYGARRRTSLTSPPVVRRQQCALGGALLDRDRPLQEERCVRVRSRGRLCGRRRVRGRFRRSWR